MKQLLHILSALIFLFLFSTAKAKAPKEYHEAISLAGQANTMLLTGEVKLADSMIRRSIKLYPVTNIFIYVRTLAKLPDLRTANQIMDLAVARVKNFLGKTLYMQSGFTGAVELSEKDYALFEFSNKAYSINLAYGSLTDIDKSAKVLWQAPNASIGFSTKYSKSVKTTSKYVTAIFHNDPAKAMEAFKELGGSKKSNAPMLGGLYYETGQYEKALQVASELDQPAYIYFYTYSLMGRVEDAEKWYKACKKLTNNRADMPIETYYLAILNIHKKEYASAVSQLIQLVANRGASLYGSSAEEPLWKIYTALGQAYSGLNEYEKAKDNYRIALLYHSEYSQAADGLAELDKKIVSQITADKTGPQIELLEPALNRGLKVTVSGFRLFVKGFAKDASGIKEITINGRSVYSQKTGEFWTDITLASGQTKLVIEAIDLAGNRAERQFEIDKASEVVKTDDIIPVVVQEGKNYALMIAAQNYSDNTIPSLENPVADAVKLKLILKNDYSFSESNIKSLFNPSANDLRRQLLELTNILQPEDKLVIFYAGHGIWVDKEKKGYWLLTDAKRNDSNTWLSNRDVLDLIAKVPARHTLLITDACFSGSVFKTRSLGEGAPVALEELDSKISRIAITSGNDTEVPDESVFMKYLIKALSENKDKYLTAQKMFINQIIEAVMTETKTEPRYGTLELAGHVGGDFIFTKK